MWPFVSILPLIGLSMLSSLGLGNVWVHKYSGELHATHVQTNETSTRKDAIDRRLYLLNVFRGRKCTEHCDNFIAVNTCKVVTQVNSQQQIMVCQNVSMSLSSYIYQNSS